VVCSDGLWRYADHPSELSELIARLQSEGQRGLGLASAMVDFAIDGGGHDNISVAIWSNEPLDAHRSQTGSTASGAESSKEPTQ